MENVSVNSRLSVFDLEKKRVQLYKAQAKQISPRYRLFLIVSFIEDLMPYPPITREAFISPLIPYILKYFHIFEATGINPSQLQRIDKVLSFLLDEKYTEQYYGKIQKINHDTKQEIEALESILEGNRFFDEKAHSILFPVIESGKSKEQSFGLLESCTITIQPEKTQKKDIFQVIPRLPDIEERLEKQIHLSWRLALERVKPKIRKLSKYHRVIIQFDRMYGYYEGNSLGVALTVGFMQELLQTYNSRQYILFSNAVASTGSVDEHGRIHSVSEEVILEKTDTIFFSGVETFIVPEEDYVAAKRRLSELQKEYPKRDPKILRTESIDDLLDRRRLITIQNQPLPIWTMRTLWQNKVAVFLAIIILAITGFLYVTTHDDNPAELRQVGDNMVVFNQYGEALWDFTTINTDEKISHIIDVDDDGVNEVLVITKKNADEDNKKQGAVLVSTVQLYDHKKMVLWSYAFSANISTKYEDYLDMYSIKFHKYIKTDSVHLLLFDSRHHPFYPSALFTLDAKTGERSETIFWNQGHIEKVFVVDIDNDEITEIVAFAYNNALNGMVLFSIELPKLTGQGIGTDKYRFINIEDTSLANFDEYVLLPKSDYHKIWDYRFNQLLYGKEYHVRIDNEKQKISFGIIEGTQKEGDRSLNIFYIMNYDFDIKTIALTDRFITARDSFVVKGVLDPPFSDTKEYTEIMKNKFRYWDNGEFIPYQEWKKRRGY